ncbi:MAG: HAD family hydrolase [Thermoplasmatota archaeon]
MSLHRARAFVFDLDDTLIDWSGAERRAFAATVADVLEPLGIDLPAARAAYTQVLEENFRAYQKDGRWWYARDRLRRLLEILDEPRLHADDVALAFRGHVDAQIGFLDGAMDLLDALRERGLAVGLLTNGPAPFQREKFDRLDVADRFDFVGISGELGHWKPDEAAFQAVAAGLGVPVTDWVMVGDSLHFDLEPAKALGATTVWMRPPEPDPAQGPPPPWSGMGPPVDHALATFVDHVVDSPAQLLGLLAD